MPRLFAAIEIPDDVRQSLARLRQPLPGANWVEPENYHLSLRFAGDIDPSTAREFTDLLARIETETFELRLTGLGAFGGREPRSIWAGASLGPQLETLARAVERAARSAGLAPETRNFKPHVTIARLRYTSPEVVARYLERHAAFRSMPFAVERFVLFSSRPKVGGGPYVVEAAFPLAGASYADFDEEWSTQGGA
jgi:2'-5' RNA ligase